MTATTQAQIEHRHFLEDFPPGRIIPLGQISVSAQEIMGFAREYDNQSFHTDEDLAKHSPFGGLVASGWHTAGLCTRLVCEAYLKETACNGSPGVREMRWLKPLRPGDRLTGQVEILDQAISRSKPDRGASIQQWTLQNQRGETIFTAEITILMMRRPKDEAPTDAEQAQQAGDGQASAAPQGAPEAKPEASAKAQSALDQWRLQAQGLWFNEGSCTAGQPEQ